MKISILLTTYNGASCIKETVDSLLKQNYKNYEIIAHDNSSKDNTVGILKSYKNPKIKIYINKINLGYPKNLEGARQKATGDILFLMGQDDLLADGVLQKINDTFQANPEIGAISRPYYWFNQSSLRPVRAKPYLSLEKDILLNYKSNLSDIFCLIDSLDQLSGLAYRRKFMTSGFHPDIFPCHIYPFLEIFKKHPVVFQGEYTIAVRIQTSQSRWLKSTYEKSPILSWVEMIKNTFREHKFIKLQKNIIENFVAKNYVGLVQIRNYGSYIYLLREAYYLIKFRPRNILEPKFWFYFLMCALTPRKILIAITDWYKDHLLSKTIHIKTIS